MTPGCRSLAMPERAVMLMLKRKVVVLVVVM